MTLIYLAIPQEKVLASWFHSLLSASKALPSLSEFRFQTSASQNVELTTSILYTMHDMYDRDTRTERLRAQKHTSMLTSLAVR